MCRVDDYCSWYVESRNDEAVAETDLRCEDCFRVIAAGEVYTRFTCMPGPDYEGDEPSYIFIIQMERDCKSNVRHRKHIVVPDSLDEPLRLGTVETWLSFDRDKPHHRIEEESAEIWECYGYRVFEEENPDLQEPDHISCAQCVKANKWLEVICQQNVVLCTREDLNEHMSEYDPEMLGEDFVMLVDSVNRAWRRSMGISLLTPEWVADHTERAIDHAIAKGLQEMARA